MQTNTEEMLEAMEIDPILLTQEEWRILIIEHNLSDDFIREHQHRINWGALSSRAKLSEDLIREFKHKVDWESISYDQQLSESFIREFQEKLNWSYISARQSLSESFIGEFQYKVNWSEISLEQTLSEDFIRKFQDNVDWEYISSSQKLSESFILEFQDDVVWSIIPIPNLSVDFICKHKERLYLSDKSFMNLTPTLPSGFTFDAADAFKLIKHNLISTLEGVPIRFNNPHEKEELNKLIKLKNLWKDTSK